MTGWQSRRTNGPWGRRAWLILALLGLRVASADPFGFPAYDLAHLAEPRAGRAHLASSADPGGGNDDRGHYLRWDGDEAVLAEFAGPGQLTRLWSANPQGTLRIYFEGETIPRVVLPMAALGEGSDRPPAVAGYVSTAGGGVSCWFPLPFQRRCRVTVQGAEQLYYQVNATTFPAGTPVTTFSPERAWRAPSAEIEGRQVNATASTVPAGGRQSLWALPGAGVIRRLTLRVTGPGLDGKPSLETLRHLRLVCRWDGAAPSVDAPLLDFFAAGFGPAQVVSAPLTVTDWDTFTCDFPMPFRSGASVELANDGPAAATIGAQLWLAPAAPSAEYFHAAYHREATVAGQPHRLATLTGRGHYVGTSVTLLGNESLAYLEGDETLTADGERLQGTGTEDYFDGAWYFRGGAFCNPYAGAPLLLCGKSALAAYRWHIADCVPFTRSLTAVLEHGAQNDSPGCTYRSVAYWYAASPGPVPAAAAPPPPPACSDRDARSAIEAETLAGQAEAPHGTLRVIDDTALPLRASGGRALQVTFTPQAGGEGVLALPLQAPAVGLYELTLRVVGGNGVDAVAATLDNQPLARRPKPSPPRLGLGTILLTPGHHRLLLRCALGTEATRWLALDQLVLREVGKIKGALEAETLPVSVDLGDKARLMPEGELSPDIRHAGDVVGGGLDPAPVLSGGQALLFIPAAVGHRATVTFQVEQDGWYGVAASLLRGPEAGGCGVLLDGRTLVPTTRPLQEHRDRAEVGGRDGIGTHWLRAGRHRLTLVATGSGAAQSLALDYLLATPSRGHEAEFLPVVALRGAGHPVVKERFGAEPRWSGGAYLRVPGGAPGATFISELFVPRSGRYRVNVKPVRLATGGRFTLTLAGRTLAELDSRGRGEQPGQAKSAEVALRRGANRLTLQALDSGDMALDTLELEYVAPLWGPLLALVLGGVALVVLAVVALRKWKRR